MSLLLSLYVCVGITQDRIDQCRGAKEAAMLADVQALVQREADLNAQDNNGATLVRQRRILRTQFHFSLRKVKSGAPGLACSPV